MANKTVNKKICIFVCAAIVAACSKPEPLIELELQQPDLETIPVANTMISREIIFDGVVEAINQATVAAQTTGRVAELPFDVGDFVEKGQVIVRVTDEEQQARLASAQAAVNAAQAQLADAQQNFDRIQEVFEKKLVAKADFDRAETQLKTARANLIAAESHSNEAQQGVNYTVVKAPYNGIVLRRMVDVGEAVSPGKELMTGLSLEQLRVVVDISQQHIGPLRINKQARIILNNESSITANDFRIPPAADNNTHTFRVLVSLSAGNFNIFPGTLVKVAFVSGTRQQLVVPAHTLAQRGELTAVYVVKPDNRIEFRYVRIGEIVNAENIEILAGLIEGEQVAIDPIAAARVYRSQFERGEMSGSANTGSI